MLAIKRIGKTLGSNLIVEMSQNEWSSIRDNSNVSVKVVENKLMFDKKKEFYEWIMFKDFSEKYQYQMRNIFDMKLYGKSFSRPYELEQYVYSMKNTNNIVKTIRNYLNYCEVSESMPEYLIYKFRKILKIKKSRSSVFVPETKQVIENYKRLGRFPSHKLLYLVLACSGARISTALELVKSRKDYIKKQYKGFVCYIIDKTKGTKNTNAIFLPDFVDEKLFFVGYNYCSFRNRYYKIKDIDLTLKYLRKWNADFLFSNSVPREVIDFIQGRSSSSVFYNHYFNGMKQAERYYGEIVDKLGEIFEKAGRLA